MGVILSDTVSLMTQLQVGDEAGHVVLVREAVPPPAPSTTYLTMLESASSYYILPVHAQFCKPILSQVTLGKIPRRISCLACRLILAYLPLAEV